ncbi:MAG: nucleotide exchange factor GrpE [Bacillota bacterium]|nr:nucleotide exchange factor GrpE [Bacillota bacterium]
MNQDKELARDPGGTPAGEGSGPLRNEPEHPAGSPEPEQDESEQNEGDAQVELSRQLEVKQQELEEMWQRYLRLAADFENFRRRSQQEIDVIRRRGAEDLIRELLPVVDNFERALVSARALFPENVVTGVEMIYRQLWTVLSQAGLQVVEAGGRPFDPVYHEAFEQVETDEYPDGTVISEVQKGYLLRGKVLRPALVKVAKNTSTPENPPVEDATKEEDDRDE